MNDMTTTTTSTMMAGSAGGGVNIDTLLARIRQFAQERAARNGAGTASAGSEERQGQKRAGAAVEALRAQTELNRSFIQAMEWIASYFQQIRGMLEDTSSRSQEGMDGLRREFGAALAQALADSERKMSAEAEARDAQVAGELAARIDRLETRVADALARVDGVSARVDAVEMEGRGASNGPTIAWTSCGCAYFVPNAGFVHSGTRAPRRRRRSCRQQTPAPVERRMPVRGTDMARVRRLQFPAVTAVVSIAYSITSCSSIDSAARFRTSKAGRWPTSICFAGVRTWWTWGAGAGNSWSC